MLHGRYCRLITKERITVLTISLLITAVISDLFYGTPLLFPIGMILYKPISKEISERDEKKRKNELAKGFRDLLNSLASSFSTGKHMKEAMGDALRDLMTIYTEDDIIIKEVKRMKREMEDGASDIHVLQDFDKRSGIEDVTLFVQVYGAGRVSGGDIAGAMADVASMLGDKIRIEDEIKKMTSQKKTEGMMISVMPVLIILFLRMVSPEYIGTMYGNAVGIAVMTLAIILTCYAFFLIKRITDIDV